MKRKVKVTDEYRMARIRRTLLSAQQHACLYYQQLMTKEASEHSQPVVDMTMRQKACMELVRGVMAMERARQNAQAGPKVFGLVMMQDRIPDERRWEQMHAKVVEDAIEAKEVVPALAAAEGEKIGS